MEISQPLQINASDWVSGGLFVVFSNGEEAFFPAELLHSMLPQATRIHVEEDDTDEEQA